MSSLSLSAAAGGAAGRGIGAGRGDPDAAVRAGHVAGDELRRRGGGADGAHLRAAEQAGQDGRQVRGGWACKKSFIKFL
jgi:hypothetical protein